MRITSPLLVVLFFLLSMTQVYAQSSCPDTGIEIALLTDNYASETSWLVESATGQTVASGNGYTNNTQYTEQVCLAAGSYVFTLLDSYGDGICCSYGNGSYAVTSAGSEIVSGGSFSHSESTAFTLTSGSTQPPPSNCNNNAVDITIGTDNYGSETSWSLTRNGSQVAEGGGYSNNSEYADELCLTDGTYTFVINDSYGDGICCNYGSGYYSITMGSTNIGGGGEFASQDTVSFTLPLSGNGGNNGGGNTGNYYDSAAGLSGFNLKTALHNIINAHSSQGYSALWSFYSSNETDSYYESDNTIIDIYSENPSGSDPYNFTPGSDQCGSYNSEADCYNREHSFPRSWFGGSIEPMNSDVHHIFPTDGQVNAWRGSYPYGNVGNATRSSSNGSRVGSGASGLGHNGTVFEPIDEFKGDVARAQFYMATRYQDRISAWQNNSSSSSAVLDGTSNQVFESWYINLLTDWHNSDPVSQKEIDRNDAAEVYQGNRNPFVDHPEWVESIWGQ